MLAARFGGSAVVEHLLSVSGAYALKDVDANHETALFLAVKGGHVEPGGIAESILAKYGFHEHEMEVLEIKNASENARRCCGGRRRTVNRRLAGGSWTRARIYWRRI